MGSCYIGDIVENYEYVKELLKLPNWAQQFYQRKTGASFSKEMARSVRVALKKWDGRKL